ncbi:uncharacterized protein [Prorops nasuta]|uniref:uncharacterized protein n=1 Tax=Prorops nasuta TaxID=863751 RepID=UPI0034CEEE62
MELNEQLRTKYESKKKEYLTFDKKLTIIELIKEFSAVIENKKTDAVSTSMKNKSWDEISTKFYRMHGQHINSESLRTFWVNTKTNTRKHYAKLKQELYKTGGGRNEVKPNILYEKAYEIIQKSVDGLYNPFDSDTSFSSSINTPVENYFEEEADDPDDADNAVFQFLIDENEVNQWDKWSPNQLKKPISPPLSNKIAVNSTIKKKKIKGDLLLESKLELAHLMKQHLLEKANYEKKILNMQLKKEELQVKLLEVKLKESANMHSTTLTAFPRDEYHEKLHVE